MESEPVNSPDAVTPDGYANEPIRFQALQVVDLAFEAAAVSEPYRNQVITQDIKANDVLRIQEPR